MSKPKTQSIGEIEASRSSSIWVLNLSNPKGNITITVPNGMGNIITVIVPTTWIPIDMTTQATKQSLLASPIFRRMMTLGMIGIISEDEAQKLLAAPDAQTENQRIYAMPRETTMDGSTVPHEVANMKSEVSGEVSGFALNIAHTESLDEAQVMNAIRGNESTMSTSDMKYIVANSKYGKVKTFLTERLLNATATN